MFYYLHNIFMQSELLDGIIINGSVDPDIERDLAEAVLGDSKRDVLMAMHGRAEMTRFRAIEQRRINCKKGRPPRLFYFIAAKSHSPNGDSHSRKSIFSGSL